MENYTQTFDSHDNEDRKLSRESVRNRCFEESISEVHE